MEHIDKKIRLDFIVLDHSADIHAEIDFIARKKILYVLWPLITKKSGELKFEIALRGKDVYKFVVFDVSGYLDDCFKGMPSVKRKAIIHRVCEIINDENAEEKKVKISWNSRTLQVPGITTNNGSLICEIKDVTCFYIEVSPDVNPDVSE